MRKQIRLYLIIIGGILPLLPSATVRAQHTFVHNYNANYITLDEGLPHNFVDDIYKDSGGFLWISMAGGGLSRYDGYRFVNFAFNSSLCPIRSNFVRNVVEDGFRRLWVVSDDGIDIIDLATLRTVPLLASHPQTDSLWMQPSSVVICDSKGCIWLHCNDHIYRISFDGAGNIREVHSMPAVPQFHNYIFLKDIDADGEVWVGLNGGLYKAVASGGGSIRLSPVSPYLTFEDGIGFTDVVLKENEIWIATNTGLFRYNRNRSILKRYRHVPGDPYSLSQNYLTSLAVTPDDQLLVGSLRGLNVYNAPEDNFERIEVKDGNMGDCLLNSNFINCIMVDDKRNIWIGTENGGINRLNSKRLSMRIYRHDERDPATLSGNPVNAIYEDSDHVLWVGTVEGGLNRKAPGSNVFTHYTYEDGLLSHNSVSAIAADPQGRLWVGTWGGGINLLDRKHPTRRIKTIPKVSFNHSPLDFIGALAYDSINNGMWVGANQGIYFYDLERQTLRVPLSEQNIRGCIGILIDRTGKLWMGCMDGVYVIDLRSRKSPDGHFSYRHFKYKLDDPALGIIDKITCFYEGMDGTIWLGSNGYGLYKRETDSTGNERFRSYTIREGLPSNCIRGILEDENENLWVATNNGLSRFIPSEERFVNYTQQDGIPDAQFYWNGACRSFRGVLYFGCMTGLLAVYGDLPSPPDTPSPVRFTRLLIDNSEVPIGSHTLPQDIVVTKEIRIHERAKSFTVEFSSLNYDNSDTTTYRYRLLGFNDQWISTSNDLHFASYTNLSPGTYTLQVEYAAGQRDEAGTRAELRIVILPYFYKTTWFIALVVVLALAGVWLFYRWRVSSFKRQQALLHREVERRTQELNRQKQLLEQQAEELSRQNLTLTQQNEKITRQKDQLTRMTHDIKELNQDRIAFFTNITHEFRTPLTLIIGPIERALKLSKNPQVIEQLNFVEKNSKYLLSLINQLMDFRKVNAGKVEIVRQKNNFLRFVDELLVPFKAFAQERNIRIECLSRLDNPVLFYDEESMRKVLTNLLSNAIKFTPDGGRISLYIARLRADGTHPDRLYICVSDTGTGIPADDLEKVFGRFFQSKNQPRYPMYGQAGSGIGLYLCKRIVQSLDGDIHARNNRGAGCSLRVLLPVPEQKGNLSGGRRVHDWAGTGTVASGQAAKDVCILVVEDNPDMRSYIRSILSDSYGVKEAADGVEALEVLKTEEVDFIISDIMMPRMDGIEFSRRVKENLPTSHIPFLMLTAKTSPESRIESYEVGVDAYIQKPFSERLLLTRIRNILNNRKRDQLRFSISMDTSVLRIAEKSNDKAFINRIMEILQNNYKNPDFRLSEFCKAAGTNKTLLTGKLHSLVGQTPNQLIRNYRLNTARQLLLQKRGQKNVNIADIAYEVGFNDPKYFTRCFTKAFNVPPRDVLAGIASGSPLQES